MSSKALYYPYINLPKEDWTLKTLLYWDSMLSIVPSSYIQNPDNLDPFMLSLVREGLVEQIFPAQHLHGIDNYDEIFINFIENKYLKHKKNILSSEYTLIHMEKLNSIAEKLVAMNLAFEKDSSWLFVEKNIANDFMTYLANILSKVNGAIPVSDTLDKAKLYDKNASYYSNKKQYKIRNTILDKVLPYPSGHFSINDLVKFKRDYGHLLPQFRRVIEEKSYEISLLPSNGQRKDKVENIINDINNQSGNLQEAMKSKFNKITFGSLLPIFGASLGIYDANTNIAVIGTLAGLSGNLHTALNDINSNINQQPMAYIAHANRKIV